jgi:hypothetical protein
MDPFSIGFGVAGLLPVVIGCFQLAKAHIGPSSISSPEAKTLLNALLLFQLSLEALKRYMDLNQHDPQRLQALQLLDDVLTRCNDAIRIIKARLQNKSIIDKALRGAKFDKNFKTALKTVDEATKVFNFAMLADQQYGFLVDFPKTSMFRFNG